ncbi:MAG TPA: ABC transporter permease [Candidatus Acidoferrales bacterium]|nr:ABC transporter permease [Candidatus Acidoferrales bacterium]
MTRIFAYAGEALAALGRNKMRAILTMLGIFIGVGSVDAVYALSTGAAAAISDTVSTGDQPALTIYPDPQQADPAIAYLSYRDATAIAQSGASAIRRAIPDYSLFYNNARIYNVRQGGGNKKVAAFGFSWYGGDADLLVLTGRRLSAQDESSAAQTALVSAGLAEKLFGSDANAVDQSVDIRGTRFRIVGVTDKDQGTASNYFGGTYYFVLPYTTYHAFEAGRTDALLIWTNSPEDEAAAKASALDELHRSHGAAAKYLVQSTRESIEQFDRVLNIVAIGLTAIGGISLFVAGIGIMNIMLVSVTERTREIGIRKAIGAKSSDIVLQFVIEAVLLSLAGGVLGYFLALGIIALCSGYLANKFGPFVVPYATLFGLALLFSLVVGVLFGVYPALRASRLAPVEALRA